MPACKVPSVMAPPQSVTVVRSAPPPRSTDAPLTVSAVPAGSPASFWNCSSPPLTVVEQAYALTPPSTSAPLPSLPAHPRQPRTSTTKEPAATLIDCLRGTQSDGVAFQGVAVAENGDRRDDDRVRDGNCCRRPAEEGIAAVAPSLQRPGRSADAPVPARVPGGRAACRGICGRVPVKAACRWYTADRRRSWFGPRGCRPDRQSCCRPELPGPAGRCP